MSISFGTTNTTRRARELLACLLIAAAVMADAGMAASAEAASPSHVSAPAVKAGSVATLSVTGASRFCRFTIDGKAITRRVPATNFQARWSVPRTARSGGHRVAVGCGADRGAANAAPRTHLTLRVRHGHGDSRAVAGVARIYLRVGERLALGGKLPPGKGNPSAVHAQLPAGTGGGPFATYLPFAQGAQVPVTQGPGGTDSHYTQYTKYAVDFGVPAGTEIHAGFTGVIARVNTGCTVGDHACGDGYGNYIYEKASDDSCAVYAHLSAVSVRPGQQVTQYDVLATSGETGDAWGAHLHFSRVNCTNNVGMPWSAIETDQFGQGSNVTSANHPPEQPCTAIQGGCVDPQSTTSPQQPGGPPVQGTAPPTGGGGAPPAPTITAAKGGAYQGGYSLDIAVHDFPTGTYTYECHDNSGSGGADTVFYTHSVTVSDPNQSSWPGVFCDDSAPYTAYLVMNGVRSNDVGF
jgi:murein DD-endopeptidase MepM/ murein hydrolase activator NlpD